MANWHRIASVNDVPAGTGREFVVVDRIVAVFHAEGGGFHALDGVCPHQGGPLGRGKLVGCVVTCPWHGWQFDVCTGQHVTSPSVLHTVLPVKVEGNDVFVDVTG